MFFNVVFSMFVCYSAAFCQLCFYKKDWIGLDWMIDVELLDKCIRNLKCGKASGPDNISAEHLQYAHPTLR